MYENFSTYIRIKVLPIFKKMIKLLKHENKQYHCLTGKDYEDEEW